jgi:hypothetical protein
MSPQIPSLSGMEAAEFKRRRRGRNLALLTVLLALAALFFAITIAKLSGRH